MLKDSPAGNILLSASILFAGASPVKILRVLQHISVQCITERTFFRHQQFFLQPVIVQVWEKCQKVITANLKAAAKPLYLGGDARADSPGHTAKFGSYTVMELKSNKIVDVQLVQKNEVANSNAMELEGLKRAVTWMKQEKLFSDCIVENIVTDRHPIKKKLTAIGKKKGCEGVNPWIRSIINHVYWCAASTPDGNPELMKHKFLSIGNHVQDIHADHPGELFTSCLHPTIPQDRPKQWLKAGTKACELLMIQLQKRTMLNDVSKMSPLEQTSNIEAFHALINQFAPKMNIYSYEGMTCRILLAAIHYNENSERAQAKNKAGQLMYSIDFPRAKSGDYTLRKRLVQPTYMDDLLCKVVEVVCSGDKTLRQQTSRLASPPPALTSTFIKPTHEEALQRQMTRFKRIEELQVFLNQPQNSGGPCFYYIL
ncbi:hypothetical protein BSL78_02303 [Apostichopus japonicus]|uniref:Uncharacterized protein n=1 Tax=Stichopus japonicus TaxID=307972 RepID=A0A2G8LKF7_STIJA|nr:hypothetical protein BSL78_02303 [Apostichopus japonicus]